MKWVCRAPERQRTSPGASSAGPALLRFKPERCSWSAEFIPQERGMFNLAAAFHHGALLFLAATLQ